MGRGAFAIEWTLKGSFDSDSDGSREDSSGFVCGSGSITDKKQF